MFKIGSLELKSRLLLGTGKFDNEDIQTKAIEASETNVLTFAVRRMNLYDKIYQTHLQILISKILLHSQIQLEQKQRKKRFVLLKLLIMPVYVT